MDEDKQTHDLELEIFSTGKWNGADYSDGDLDNMVENFNILGSKVKAPLKIGHNDKQELVKSDGMPAIGWVQELKRQGNKLIAKVTDIPKKVYELISRKAYRRVSSEIIWNFRDAGNIYKRVLCGVALLGADMPAVSNLSDILGLYSLNSDDENYDIHYCYIKDEEKEETSIMDNNKIQELENELKAQEEKIVKLSADKDQEIESLKLELVKTEKDKVKTKVYSLLEKGLREGKIPPAVKEHFAALIIGEENEQGVVHKYSEGEIKSTDKLGMLENLIENMPKIVKFSEETETPKEEEKIKEPEVSKPESEKKDEIAEKVEEEAKKENLSYAEYTQRLKDAYKNKEEVK